MNRPTPPTRDVNALVGANFFAQLADQLSLTAIPLIAVLSLGLGAGGVGTINALQTLPYLLLSIPLGVLVDRVSKRGVMLVTELVRVAALVAILVLVYVDRVEVWSLAVLGFLAAFGSVGFNAALPAYLPALVEKRDLSFYNGRLELMRSLSLMLGPAMAGALAAWFGASNVFILGVVLTVLTMVFVANIARSGRVENPDAQRKTPLRDIADGARFIVRSSQLSTIMLVAFVWNTAWFTLQAAFMPIAIQTWGLTAEVVGYALGCMGIGLLAGSLLSQRIIGALGFGAALAFGPVVSFVAALLIVSNVAYETAVIPALAFFLFGFGPVIWVITSNTLRQVVTPGHMIGCVSSMYLTANWGARPFGALIGAVVGTTWGEVACLVLAATLFFVQMMLVFLTGLFRSGARMPEQA
ncbi:MFS transporter [Salinarimonas chemoclinalis]|uniref:MFS transporter n=1 Tax=Salinarimonas chemoclinalis TaxID=3241599 RepID=UPI00355812D5